MRIKCIVNGKWNENCYLVSENRSMIIIDPGGNAEEIITYINKHQFSVQAIINTHGHFDHIGAVLDLCDEYECPFYLHSKDVRLVRSANLYMKLFSGEKPIRIPRIDFSFDKIPNPVLFNDFTVDVLFTPGHTEGSVCFLIGNSIFTGDTLLKGAVGRTDLPGGNKEQLKTSIRQIARLSEKLIIYPGHGESGLLSEEITTNQSLISLLQ